MLNVSSNPHVRSEITTSLIMLTVIICLSPALIYGIFHFGIRALIITLFSICTCVISEMIFNAITKRKNSLYDLSAVVTGVLLAMNLPSTVPYWVPVIGGIFAIMVVKMLFGGLGQNFMNPALGARCFLIISFPKLMTAFNYDGLTSATPLQAIRNGEPVSLINMFIGNTGGTIGETSAVALLVGGIGLIVMGVIDIYIPVLYIVTFSLCMILFSGHGFDITYIASQICGGGLMLGAFFMATDYATRPITAKGQIIYGIFLGLLTGIFRSFGPSAEGVSYAIIIGNLIVPLIDKITIPAFFGKKGAGV